MTWFFKLCVFIYEARVSRGKVLVLPHFSVCRKFEASQPTLATPIQHLASHASIFHIGREYVMILQFPNLPRLFEGIREFRDISTYPSYSDTASILSYFCIHMYVLRNIWRNPRWSPSTYPNYPHPLQHLSYHTFPFTCIFWDLILVMYSKSEMFTQLSITPEHQGTWRFMNDVMMYTVWHFWMRAKI